jgi:hypothetical protein
MNIRRWGVALVLVALGGCGKSQPADPAHDAWVQACHAQDHVAAGATNNEIVRWIETNVHDPSVRDVFSQIAQGGAGDKATVLRAAAAKAQVTDCPLVDKLWPAH